MSSVSQAQNPAVYFCGVIQPVGLHHIVFSITLCFPGSSSSQEAQKLTNCFRNIQEKASCWEFWYLLLLYGFR